MNRLAAALTASLIVTIIGCAPGPTRAATTLPVEGTRPPQSNLPSVPPPSDAIAVDAPQLATPNPTSMLVEGTLPPQPRLPPVPPPDDAIVVDVRQLAPPKPTAVIAIGRGLSAIADTRGGVGQSPLVLTPDGLLEAIGFDAYQGSLIEATFIDPETGDVSGFRDDGTTFPFGKDYAASGIAGPERVIYAYVHDIQTQAMHLVAIATVGPKAGTVLADTELKSSSNCAPNRSGITCDDGVVQPWLRPDGSVSDLRYDGEWLDSPSKVVPTNSTSGNVFEPGSENGPVPWLRSGGRAFSYPGFNDIFPNNSRFLLSTTNADGNRSCKLLGVLAVTVPTQDPTIDYIITCIEGISVSSRRARVNSRLAPTFYVALTRHALYSLEDDGDGTSTLNRYDL
jgi:hypothetical protein